MGKLWMNATCTLVAVVAVLFALKPGGKEFWEYANVAKSFTPSNSLLWNLGWKGEAEQCTCQVINAGRHECLQGIIYLELVMVMNSMLVQCKSGH